MRVPSLNVQLGRRRAPELVGLDIQPGYAVAVQARANGSVVVQRAAGVPIPGDAMREGEVLDDGLLAEALHELFAKARLDKRVRIGVANQRTVLRMLELPPLTDRKELATAVRFQAEDQVPMPLENAVLDFHPLGIVDAPGGQRQRVAVVAAQRDMIQRLLSAVRRAGLRPEAIDLSAFALIRALHRPSAEAPAAAERVLYLNVGGLTNLAIAEGPVCRFTRVVGGGLESIAATVAETHHIPLSVARELVAAADLERPQPDATTVVQPDQQPVADDQSTAGEPSAADDQSVAGEPSAAEHQPSEEPLVKAEAQASLAHDDPDVLPALHSGVREIAGEVRNSLDFHRSQGGGGEVTGVVLSGPALEIRGFTQALSAELGIEVRTDTVALSDGAGEVPAERLAIAAGLTIEEAPGR